MPLAGSIIEGGLGLGKAIFGGIDAAKAKKEEDAIAEPFYKIQDEFKQNRDIAAAQAGQGLPTATKNYLTTATERGLGSSIGALEQTGGNQNDLGSILDTYNKSLLATAAQDAAEHTKNIQMFMDANNKLAGEKIKAFSINEYEPYQNKIKQLQERRAADRQNLFGGLSDTAGAVSAFGIANQNEDLMKLLQGIKQPNGGGNQPLGNVNVEDILNQYPELKAQLYGT